MVKVVVGVAVGYIASHSIHRWISGYQIEEGLWERLNGSRGSSYS